MSKKLERQSSSALFALFALLHGLSLASRFPELMRQLPPWAPGAVLLAQFPLLLLAVFFDARQPHADEMASLPIWMRLRSRPLKLGLALAFAYFAVVVVQVWDIQLGPVDPSPPPEWPLQQRAMHFGLMCLVMLLPGYIAIASLIVLPLRALAKLLRNWPAALAAALVAAVGLGAGYGALVLIGSDRVSLAIGSVKSMVQGDVTLMLAVTLGVVLVPVVFGLLRGARER